MTRSGLTPRRTSSGSTSAALPSRPTETGLPAFTRAVDDLERLVERLGRRRRDSRCAGGTRCCDGLALDGQHRGAGHGGGQRLRPPMPPRPAVRIQRPREIAAVVAAAHLDEGLVGALHDALRADVDPGARRHLAVHHQALAIELVEMVPGRPVRHEVGVGDQHARRVGVGLEHADRLARLDQQRLVRLRAGAASSTILSKACQSRAARPMPP